MMDFVDFKTLKRPSSPNTYLVAPEGLCEASKPDQRSKSMPVAPDHLFKMVLALVEQRKDWNLEESDEEKRTIAFVAVSPIMRYKDDVDVLIMADASAEGKNSSKLAIYSRSRVGYSDMGANKKRVSQLLEGLKGVQVAT